MEEEGEEKQEREAEARLTPASEMTASENIWNSNGFTLCGNSQPVRLFKLLVFPPPEDDEC